MKKTTLVHDLLKAIYFSFLADKMMKNMHVAKVLRPPNSDESTIGPKTVTVHSLKKI